MRVFAENSAHGNTRRKFTTASNCFVTGNASRAVSRFSRRCIVALQIAQGDHHQWYVYISFFIFLMIITFHVKRLVMFSVFDPHFVFALWF